MRASLEDAPLPFCSALLGAPLLLLSFSFSTAPFHFLTISLARSDTGREE